MRNISECVETNKQNTKFFRREAGITFTLQADKEFLCEIVAIDNCVFKDSTLRRCDYLFVVPKKHKKDNQLKKSRAYYVELKGVNTEEACEQLYNAIDRTKQEILNHDIEAKIIAAKGFQPNILNNGYFKKVKKMIGKDIVVHKVHKGNNFNHIETIKIG